VASGNKLIVQYYIDIFNDIRTENKKQALLFSELLMYNELNKLSDLI